MKIHVYNRQRDLKISKPLVRQAVQVLCSYLSISCDEISIYFITEKKIASMHKQFFNDPTPTDCITFPLDQSYLGDLFCSPAAAIQFAKKQNQDPYEELLLYIVHGMLHLIGYDDLNSKEKRRMREKEKQCMKQLKGLHISLTQ